MEEDLYKILGVSKDASPDEIKKVYKKLAMKYHPDRNKGDANAEEKFKSISTAYDTLSDPTKRSNYDNSGQGPQGFGNPGGFGFTDMFGDIFRRQHQQPEAQIDLTYQLTISLEDAFNGAQRTIKYNKSIKCEPCNGKGSSDDSSIVTCSVCRGSGILASQNGPFMVQHNCHACDGKGKQNTNPCTNCGGSGHVSDRTDVDINIPRGIISGNRLQLNHKGNYHNGKIGNLYIIINVEEHPLFNRHGHDLIRHLSVPFTTLCNGGTVNIETLDGEITMKVSEGTDIGSVMRIRGKGMPHMNSGTFGDLKCIIDCMIPKNLTDEQKQLLEDFNNSFSE